MEQENVEIIDTRSEETKREEAMQDIASAPVQPEQSDAPLQPVSAPILDQTVVGGAGAVAAIPKRARAKKQPVPAKVAPPTGETAKPVAVEPPVDSQPLPKPEEIPAPVQAERVEAKDNEEEKEPPAVASQVSGVGKTANLIRKPLSSIITDRYIPPVYRRVPAITPDTLNKASKWARRFKE